MPAPKILSLLLVLASICRLSPVSAEKGGDEVKDFEGIDDFGEFDLDELVNVVFTASKHEQDIAESPSAITVITREQIEHTHCTDVVCLLRQVPEVDARRLAPMFSAIGARALTDVLGDRTLVIIDGREINFELFGFALWQALPVHLEDIERIEVIRGPGSALYGANAHSMVVSIKTRRPSESRAEIFLGAGELDRTSLHLRVGQPLGNWRLQLSGGIETAGHWQIPNRREREVGRIRMHLDHQSGKNITTLQLGMQNAEGAIYSPFGWGAVNDGILAHVHLSHQREALRAQTSYSVGIADFPLGYPMYYQGIKLGDLPEKVPFSNHSLDTELQYNFRPWDDNLLIAGGNYRWIVAYSEATEPDEIHQHRVGFYLQDEQRLFDKLVVTLGARFDYNTITPFSASPRLAAVWQFSKDQFIRLAFGQAFRKPSFWNSSVYIKNVEPEPAFPELQDFFKKSIGNPGLGNESITTFETGYHGRFLEDRLTLEADVFYNRYRDTISFFVSIVSNQFGIPDLTNSVVEHRNSGREVDSIGGSLSATFKIKELLRLNGNYTYRYSWYIAEASDPGIQGEGKGDRVSWEPAHMANLLLDALLGHGLRLGLGVHFASSFETSIVEMGIFGDTFHLEVVPTWFLSGNLSFRTPVGPGWIEIGIRAFNMLNLRFRDYPGYLRPDKGDLGGAKLQRRLFFFMRGAI